jgi:hypothetical protein
VRLAGQAVLAVADLEGRLLAGRRFFPAARADPQDVGAFDDVVELQKKTNVRLNKEINCFKINAASDFCDCQKMSSLCILS